MSIGASTCGGEFPLWRECLTSLCELCDKLIVRWDIRTSSVAVKDEIPGICGDKLASLIVGVSQWNRFNWRQSMLREIDKIGLKPTLVLAPDQDEQFGDGIGKDIERLLASGRNALMFRYHMMTADNARVPLYPRLPHMKIFRWRPGLTYVPYKGCAQVTTYACVRCQLPAESRMRHYCFYTPELRKRRRIAG